VSPLFYDFNFLWLCLLSLCFLRICIAQKQNWKFFRSIFGFMNYYFLIISFYSLTNTLTCAGIIFLATFSSCTFLVRLWQSHSSFWDVTFHQIEAWTFDISLLSQQESLLKKREGALLCGFLTFLPVLEQILFPGYFYQETQSQLELLVPFLGYFQSASL
jgi:hypothetical protein